MNETCKDAMNIMDFVEGIGNDDIEKEDKIIKNISKNVTIDKEINNL